MSTTDTDPENTVIAAPSDADRASRTARVLPIALGALCVVLAVVVGLLSWQATSAARAHKDAAAALDAARTRSVLVLSYAPQTVDADVEKARAQLSGTFAAQFDQLVNQVVLPATKQQGLSSKVDVTHAALIEPLPDPADHADVLLFMHQVVSSNSQPPQEGTIQIKVTVTKSSDGQWLVSNLQPI
ncbi:MAG: hypothetical protein H0V92_03205 [Pseudonocardiales bacterium]|nr:hypothetical protein [Pseudonocardiales bacterium]